MSPGSARSRWIALGVAALVGVALTAPASALGATVNVSAGKLNFTAASGEMNDVTVERLSANFFQVRENRASLTAGAGCTQQGQHQARCEAPGATIDIRTGNLDDRAAVVGSTAAEIRGGSGADTLTGGSGDDDLIGGPGPESGFGFSDILVGNAGDDRLVASASTSMLAGEGDDRLIGGPGNDSLDGGPGADVMRGGEGSDAADYFSSPGPVTVTLDDAPNDGAAGEGDNVRSDVEAVNGSPFDDDLTGNASANSLSGWGGNDVLRGGGGNDFLSGGNDDDLLIAGPGNDSLQGGQGADDFRGGGGVDEATYSDRFNPAISLAISINNVADDGEAGEGDNVRSDVEDVTGGAGNDTITGNAEDNRLIGGDGNDTLTSAGGNDRVFGDFQFATSTGGNDTLRGGSGDDELAGGTGDDTVNGGSGDDRIFGDHFQFATSTNGGDDLLIGGDGGDRLVGGIGADRFTGGPGFDVADYSAHSEPLEVTIDNVADDGRSGEGDDVRTTIELVVGGSGNDKLTGSAASDVLFGGPGNDVLRGEGGDDLMDGETPGMFGTVGDDVFLGGPGKDTVTYGSHFNAVTVTIDNVADDGQAGEADNVSTAVENLIGGSSSDSLTGSNAANAIAGGFGNDSLVGLGGGDFLAGEFGNDTHDGGSGNDRINSRGDNAGDVDNCGAGTDSVTADSFDVVNADCENVFNSPAAALEAGAAGEGTEQAADGEPSLAEARRLLRLARGALVE